MAITFLDTNDKKELQDQIDDLKENGGNGGGGASTSEEVSHSMLWGSAENVKEALDTLENDLMSLSQKITESETHRNVYEKKVDDLETEVTAMNSRIPNKDELVAEVIEAIGAPVFGVIDENNVITLSGDLPDGTYTAKYETEDGTIDIGEFVLGEVEPTYTNLFVVGGEGYILNGRCSSGGADRNDTNGDIATNYITVANGDTVYVKNATVSSNSGEYSGMKLADGSTIGLFPNDSTYITNYLVTDGITQFTINHANAAAIRLCLLVNYGTAITNDDVANAGIIITVNEPIV